ncbi:MAG: oligopeptide/dipeptide ABC transporter ATP-binding protein [Geminicoccaceae bacterium]
MTAPLLEVRDLVVRYRTKAGGTVRAVDGVGFDLMAGETLAIVGESGCGKSTLARAVMRLVEPAAGTVRVDGRDLAGLAPAALRAQRRVMQLVFQDPLASLDPRFTIARSLAEPLVIHGIGERAERAARVARLMAMVGLDPGMADRYPHALSGGQRQRVGIARALALEPRLLVLDEPVSALDVAIQAQVLNLLLDLKERLGLAYLFISHDLGVVSAVADRIAVMYLGQLVEQGPADAVLAAPRHPYTQALLAAVPSPDPDRPRPPSRLAGEPPNPEHPPPGCRFHPRCPVAMARCATEAPVAGAGRHAAACHLATAGTELAAPR